MKVYDEILKQIKATNYNTDLLIDDSKFDNNYYVFKETKEEIENLAQDDMINDWIVERVRRFNTSATYLIESLNSACNFKLAESTSNEKIRKNMELFVRRELRNVCINIEIYIDKVFSFIKYYFFLDKEGTEGRGPFLKTLEQFKEINQVVGIFIEYCKFSYKNEDIEFIRHVRNDEIHNESQLDLHDYSFGKTTDEIIDHGYKIRDEEIFERISNVLCILISLKNNLQNMVQAIKPIEVYDFVLHKEPLINTIKPKSRVDFKINKKLVLKN